MGTFKNIKFKTVMILLLAGIVIAASIIGLRLNSERSIDYDYLADVESVSKYPTVLRFAGGSDFSPFAYIDENGLPCGRDVELAFALGRQLGCNIEITLGDWSEMQQGLLNGTYDVLMTVDYSDDRDKIMDYSKPVCLDNYVFFGKDSSIDLSDLHNLKSLKIAALDGGGATDNFLQPLNLITNTTFYDNQLDAFKSVEEGINDVAIAGYIYGSHIIASNDLSLIQIGNSLYNSAYYFTFNRKSVTLSPTINAALSALEDSGEFDRIDEKWTEHFKPNLSLNEFLSLNILQVLSVFFVFIVLLFVITEIVGRRIRKRERELIEINQLTGLLNMHAFFNKLLAMHEKNPEKEYVLVRFDIDNFKTFNNTQGTAAGDKLLHDIGQTLLSGCMPKDIVLSGYMGADHFLLLAERFVSDIGPKEIYDILYNVISRSYSGFFLSIRMGFCYILDYDDLTRYSDRAHIALRSVKNDYYRHWAWYDDKIQAQLDDEKLVTDKMFKALDDGCFIPYFQPQYNYETKTICGAEVLARWLDYDGKLILPYRFIPLFEKNGFIYEMDKAIWRESCECLKRWKDAGIFDGHMSINISRAEIYHSDLIETIQKIIAETGVDISDIHFEITESAYIENSTLLFETISQFKSIGAYLEMDDFGSGYSSLSSLKDINVDLVKLDMSLLANNSLAGRDAAMLRNLVNLVKDLGLDIIAEGVETENQAEFLHGIGCNMMQGYLFSKPVSKFNFESMIKSQS